MTDATVPPAPTARRTREPRDPGRALLFLPLAAAGIFSAPGPVLGVGRWLLAAVAAVVAWAVAEGLVRATGARPGRQPWLRCLASGTGLALTPLAGYAAVHPDLSHPWGAAWLAGFALVWGAGADAVRIALARGREATASTPTDAAPPRDRALDAAAWLYRAAEVCLIPAIARIMESVGQPLPTLPAAAAFAVWMGVVGLLHAELRRAAEANPVFRGATVAIGVLVLALVLVVRALSRGGL